MLHSMPTSSLAYALSADHAGIQEPRLEEGFVHKAYTGLANFLSLNFQLSRFRPRGAPLGLGNMRLLCAHTIAEIE